MEKEQKDVYKVYDKIASWFAENNRTDVIEKRHLDAMISNIKANAEILDVGCGNGKPIFGYLQEKGFNVTGVDASLEMLKIAKDNFPSGNFIREDMRKLSLNKKFDAIIAWHSFFHLPQSDQPDMFRIFASHLVAGGILIFTSGTESGEAWGENGGENMFHASLDTATYKSLLLQHGFGVINHTINDLDCGGATVWMAQYNPQ
ncbi:class I SAM-dependent methyltransferase [Pedobacter sp.]|uniref:class I SAM-dependent methyltransferase n=1 Tax=Pedobacter sp. TaxID=1411316 RepID=UPI003BAA1940